MQLKINHQKPPKTCKEKFQREMRREKMTRLLLESLSGDPAVVKTPETMTREGRKSTKQGLPPSSRERSKSESCRKS